MLWHLPFDTADPDLEGLPPRQRRLQRRLRPGGVPRHFPLPAMCVTQLLLQRPSRLLHSVGVHLCLRPPEPDPPAEFWQLVAYQEDV